MPRKDYIILFWFFTLAIIAGVGNSMLGNAGSIAAIIAGVIALASAIIIVSRWLYRRKQLKDLLEVYYLIPQYQYPATQFRGAPSAEERLCDLTMGIGCYRIMFITVPKTNFSVDNMRILFSGSDRNKPKDYGYDNPFVVEPLTDTLGRQQFRDWWGNIQPVSPEGKPITYCKGTPGTTGRRIETTGKWDGEIVLEYFIREAHMVEKRLKLFVSDERYSDQIPFLKIG